MMRLYRIIGMFFLGLLFVIAVGCGGGGGSSTEQSKDIDLLLDEETQQATRFVSDFIARDQALIDFENLVKSKNKTISQVEIMDTDDVALLFSEAELNAISSNYLTKIQPYTASTADAVDQLIALENGVVQEDVKYANKRGLLAAAGTLMTLITVADVYLNCQVQYNKVYDECTRTYEANYYEKHPEAKGGYNILLVPTMKAHCSIRAVKGLNKCKESTAVNIVTSFSAAAAGPFSQAASGAINVHSTSGSIENIKKNGASVIAHWKKNCQDEAPLKRVQEPQWLYVAQSDKQTFSLPEGNWDLVTFTEGHVRQVNICKEIEKNANNSVLLQQYDSIKNTVMDNDGDGYTEAQGDCNDANKALHPDAVEVCNDGIDNNCDAAIDCDDTTCDSNAICHTSSASSSSLPSIIDDGTSVNVSITGYQGGFVPKAEIFTLGNRDDGANIYPGFTAISKPLNQYSPLTTDIVTMMFDRTLQAGNEYPLGSAFTGTGIAFSTPQIKDIGSGVPVLFGSDSGTVYIHEFGTSYDRRISGSFQANVSGEQEICATSACENPTYRQINGVISGSFNGVLKPASYYQ